MDSACALVANGQGITLVSRILGVSRAQLEQRMKTSGNKPNKHRRRCDEAADAEVLARILDIISDMPTYGYRRVWELRVDYGLGYRVYYSIEDGEIILLLIGGNKKTQIADLDKAVSYLQDFKKRSKK